MLTAAGRKLLQQYLAAERRTQTREIGEKLAATDKGLALSMPIGQGAIAATARKLFRDGYAIGQYDWAHGRLFIITDKGRDAMRQQDAA